MKRLLVVGCALLLVGCGSTAPRTASAPPPALPPAAAQAPAPPAPPSPPPSRTAHTLVLVSPPGQGAIELVRAFVYTPSALKPQSGEFDATASYTAKGSVTTVDDLAEWRFGYTNTTNLNDTQGGLANRSQWVLSVHGLAISLKNTSTSPIEIQWADSALVDPGGRTRSLIHKGVKPGGRIAPLAPSVIPAGTTFNDFAFPADGIGVEPGRSRAWTAPAFLERLEPGTGFTLTLSVKAFDKTTERTFRFEAR